MLLDDFRQDGSGGNGFWKKSRSETISCYTKIHKTASAARKAFWVKVVLWNKSAVRVLNCICEAMLDSINLLDKTFVERFVLVLFQVIIQRLVNFAVGYKIHKFAKALQKPFFHYFAQRSSYAKLCFSFSACLSFAFFLGLSGGGGGGGRDSQTPNQNFANFSPFP